MADGAPVKTFVFTDIADSSSRWEREPGAAMEAIEAHGECVRRLVGSHGGTVVKCLGDGYAAVFDEPWKGVLAAVAIQAESVAALGPIVRVGSHSGPAVPVDGDFQGVAVNRAARIASLAHPGQTLVSATTFGLAADVLGGEVEWRYIGEAKLRGHDRPEDLWQADTVGEGRSFPPPPGVEPDHNLVGPEREIVGRDRERRLVSNLLCDAHARQVTLLGFGGMGKSLLANYVAWDCLEAFDAVWWAGLELCRTEEQALAAIAASVGDGSPYGLRESLAQGRTLVVLDCCDLLSGRLGCVERFLRESPDLSVLATSRQVTGIPGEHIVELGGLDCSTTASGLSDAARLFAAVADSVGTTLSRSDRKVLGAVVGRLEGNPLAILLAAGRLRALSFEALAQRVLESPLRSIRSLHRGGRHESLRHVVETSMSLLGDEDREWTVRLSVFEGPFWLEDATAVLALEDEVEDALQRLRDSSLLAAEASLGGLAFRQLDPVREFAREVADRGVLAPIQDAHARHFAWRADQAREAYDDDRHDDALRTVARYGGNLRAGFAHACAMGDDGLVVRYVRGLARTVAEQGLTAEFEAVAAAGIAAAERLGDAALACELLGLKGIVARRAGRSGEAQEAWHARARRAAEAGDATTECDAYGDLAELSLAEGRAEEARKFWESAVRLAPCSEASDVAVWLDVLDGRIAIAQGDADAGRAAMQRLAGAQLAPDQEFFRLRSLSELARAAGDWEEARRSAFAMLRAAVERSQAPRAAQALWQLLACCRASGDSAAAEEVLQALLRLPRRTDPSTWRRAREEAESSFPASEGAFWALAAALVGNDATK